MPIKIYIDETKEEIAWISENNWDLPTQVDELSKWILLNKSNLQNQKYVADIGFDVQPESSGGGAVLTAETMKFLSEHDFDIFLSEYPNQLKKES